MDDPGADRMFDSFDGLAFGVKYTIDFRKKIYAGIEQLTMVEFFIFRAEFFFVRPPYSLPHAYRGLDVDERPDLNGKIQPWMGIQPLGSITLPAPVINVL